MVVAKAKLKVREHIALRTRSLRSGLCQRGEAWSDGKGRGCENTFRSLSYWAGIRESIIFI